MRLITSLLIILFLSAIQGMSQDVVNPTFDERLEKLLNFTVPVIDVPEANENADEYIFLDARELEEYQISHIPGARYIGYKKFDEELLKGISHDDKIIVYCSVGYRSEKIGKKLEKLGYTSVYNLYGSIFEWINCDLPLENQQGIATDTIHTYNKKWSKWVDDKEAIKVW